MTCASSSMPPLTRSNSSQRRQPPSPLGLGSIIEAPEVSFELNLGVESPNSILKPALVADGKESPQSPKDEWGKSGIALHTDVPMRKRTWRSASFSSTGKKIQRRQASAVDVDCGICFEEAVKPCKMLCCGKIFCLEHISDWINGSSSDGSCPACKTPRSHASELRSPFSNKHSSPSDPNAKPDLPFTVLKLDSSRTPLRRSASFSPPRRTSPSSLSLSSCSTPPSILSSSPEPPSPVAPTYPSSNSNIISGRMIALEAPYVGPLVYSSSTAVVLISRMVGRVLSVIGLTLFLLVLFS